MTNDDFIRIAIHEKRLISFFYRGNLRIAEPHDYGVQKGRARLLVYQTGGQSSSGRLPDWRLVDVDQISRLTVLEENFRGSRGAAEQIHHHWDVLFARVAT